MAVSQDLLDILRCPYCVSGTTRKAGDDPGQLELVNDSWLICQETDCGRKYPIKEDIPVMLIDEGDKWINTAVADLPQPGKLVEPAQFQMSSFAAASDDDSAQRQRLMLAIILSLLALTVAVAFIIWLQRQRS